MRAAKNSYGGRMHNGFKMTFNADYTQFKC